MLLNNNNIIRTLHGTRYSILLHYTSFKLAVLLQEQHANWPKVSCTAP